MSAPPYVTPDLFRGPACSQSEIASWLPEQVRDDKAVPHTKERPEGFPSGLSQSQMNEAAGSAEALPADPIRTCA